MNKKKVLVFIDWFYPAFKAGGPVKSVYNIVNSLSEAFTFAVVTSAYDLNEKDPLKEIQLNEWIQKENYQVIYLDNDHQTKEKMETIYKEFSPDLVYFNSLFSFKFTLLPLFLMPRSQKVLLAPRGMLGKEALKIKGLKKKLFLAAIKVSGRLSSVQWHASTDLEEGEIRAVFGGNSLVHVAQNISVLAEQRPFESIKKQPGRLKLLFFSRINEKKNLIFALDIMKRLNDQSVSLDIYGPVEDGNYWNSCKAIIDENSLNANYRGLINPADLSNTLWRYDYLFFPTKHENYGHVIAESLCSSLPVILSKNTPWLNLREKKLGFDHSLNEPETFVNLLSELKAQTKEEYLEFVQACFSYSNEVIVSDEVIDKNLKMFKHVSS